MFYPHLSEIHVNRDEPDISDIDMEIRRAKRNVEDLSEEIVAKDFLKNPERSVDFEDKIRKIDEFVERNRSVSDFMTVWNRWRGFYLNAHPIMPKNRSQLGTIENILELVRVNEVNLNLLIAAIHRAFVKRRVRPGFTDALSFGMEFYERFYNDVVQDIDRQIYTEDAKNG